MTRTMFKPNNDKVPPTSSFSCASTLSKEKIRREIKVQVEDFLRQGGRINVVEAGWGRNTVSIGSAWYGEDEVQRYVE